MKFLFNLLTVGMASATLPIYGKPKRAAQKVDNIPVNSNLGSKIMSQARRLENEDEVDFTWVADFSIKFQGCHHISQWNGNANEDGDGDDDDVRISTKRLIRFRLCPSDTCSATSAAGCSSSYGDYIIDMNTFLDTYYEAVEQYNEWRCEYTSQMTCGCTDDDGKDDGYDGEVCEYECFAQYNMLDICDAQNPYNDDDEEEERFQIADYAECAQYEFENEEDENGDENQDNNGERRLEEEEDETYYYIGPYCSEQGGAIYLGLFTDDSCTAFADNYGGAATFKTLSGGEGLPYASQSIISMDCVSCKEPEDFNNDGNDNEDEDEVIEMCEQIYEMAGKCETGLEATGYVDQANENACNYISGIKVVRKDGIITQVGSKANKTASIFIGIFVVAFVLLAAYVYYLKTKLDRASINLSD